MLAYSICPSAVVFQTWQHHCKSPVHALELQSHIFCDQVLASYYIEMGPLAHFVWTDHVCTYKNAILSVTSIYPWRLRYSSRYCENICPALGVCSSSASAETHMSIPAGWNNLPPIPFKSFALKLHSLQSSQQLKCSILVSMVLRFTFRPAKEHNHSLIEIKLHLPCLDLF